MKKILKYTRIAVSLLCLTIVTAVSAGWLTSLLMVADIIQHVQFMTLILTISLSTIALWIVVTYLFGRIYCSSVCPLGTFQDIFIRLPRITRRMAGKRVFRYSVPLSTLRYSTLAIVFATLPAGFTAAACILDPDAIYVRMVKLIAFEIAGASVFAYLVTLGIIIFIVVMSARRGRLWCNTICPVGTALGAISRWSVFHFDINTDLCTNCRRCEDVCKAECIDLDDHVVDGSRCINCFDCINVCRDNAINYTIRRHKLSIPMMQRLSADKRTPVADASVAADNSVTSEEK